MPNIYLTENLFNKAFGISPWRYIGSDQTDNVSYFGSNKKLKADIERLGEKYFSKSLLETFDCIDNKELRKIEATLYLQPNNVKDDPSYYNETSIYAPGGGKKGMKHRKPRSEAHIKKIIEHRTGSVKDETARQLMREKKIGTKAKLETKQKMSFGRLGEKNNNALVWTLTTPEGDIITVSGLRYWAKINGHKYKDIYDSKNGWNALKHGSGRGGGRKKKEHNSGI